MTAYVQNDREGDPIQHDALIESNFPDAVSIQQLVQARKQTEEMAAIRDQAAGAASNFGFISRPHFLGSSLCIFSISLATSGCFS
jgi:hypothetical protein